MIAIRPLRSSRDFRRVLSAGRRARRGGLVVCVAPGDGRTVHLGLAVRARPAVVRNRAKRRLRAAFRECAPGPGSVVVRTDAGAATVEFARLRADLCAALEQAGGLK